MPSCNYILLDINLSNSNICTINIPDESIKNYIGGSGLGAFELFNTKSINCDPLGPDNDLLFLTGPLTGTVCPSSGRHGVTAKSPLTGIWGEANVGGKWGKALRKAGWFGVRLRGISPEPVYIYIKDDKIEIRSAKSLVGMDTFKTEETLCNLTHPKAKIACIGPAGENICLLSGIFTDGFEARTAARCGLGAVMGSKRLKAIAVYGSGKPYVFDDAGLKKYVKELMPDYIKGTGRLRDKGTPSLVEGQEIAGSFPIKNFQLDDYSKRVCNINWEKMKETIFVKRVNCASCPVGCGRLVQTDNIVQGGPEYETIGILGSNLLIDDLDAIQAINEKCNRAGIDTVETGAIIGFAIEAFDRKIIGLEDTEGTNLRWGDPELVLDIIDSISSMKGFGKTLSQGFNSLIALWGSETQAFAPQVKGLGFPAHDPRAYNSIAVSFATSNRGACHLQAFSHVFERIVTMPEIGIYKVMDPFSIDEKGEKAALIQDLMCLYDSLSICKFALFGGINIKNMADMLSLATGWDFTMQSLLKAGSRIFNLKRLYNNGCGISNADDNLPERFLSEPKTGTAAKGNLPPLNKMLTDYYNFRGWTKAGVPKKEKLKELGIII